MRAVDEILERAKNLRPEERRELLDRLEDSVSDDAPSEEGQGKERYSRTLAASGVGHTDHDDVSSDKYRHLGDAYADERDDA